MTFGRTKIVAAFITLSYRGISSRGCNGWVRWDSFCGGAFRVYAWNCGSFSERDWRLWGLSWIGWQCETVKRKGRQPDEDQR